MNARQRRTYDRMIDCAIYDSVARHKRFRDIQNERLRQHRESLVAHLFTPLLRQILPTGAAPNLSFKGLHEL